ncbi:helix-turn-helix domain-containing protein [Gordonia sp. ABSL49_1]|uniref:helix-turn-helix domain-containing protein n=1 Tax=Gordonia sp. ABSL49_1 TaxID=2920941 RepID=UPI001F0EB7BE|nr:helix-turn-helix domain-containing protein [Gordonia sp. ABSL49_1]MCH5643735.1 helix-turn-helix domain-containing protein [Gordonia sp. ABSL49_1]
MTAESPGSYGEWRCATLPAVVWQAKRSAGPVRIDPDGCMDVIWTGDSVLVAGPDRSSTVSVVRSATTMTGIRFDPGHAPGLLGVSAAELVGSRVAGSDIWSRSDVERLEDRLRASVAPDRDLELWCAQRRRPPPNWVPRVVDALASGRTVSECADDAALSERSLHRQALRYFGYGPKTLARILRMRRATTMMSVRSARFGDVELSDIAAACGYSDYAHMYRDFVGFTGCAPTQFILSTRT